MPEGRFAPKKTLQLDASVLRRLLLLTAFASACSSGEEATVSVPSEGGGGRAGGIAPEMESSGLAPAVTAESTGGATDGSIASGGGAGNTEPALPNGGTGPTIYRGNAGSSGGPAVAPRPPPPEEPPIVPCAPAGEPAGAMDFCPPGPFEAMPLIENDEEEILCTREVNWAEGPIWSATDGTLYFSSFDESDKTGFYNGAIMTWRPGEGCLELWPDVGTNGLAFGVDGKLVAGRHTNRTLSRVDLTTGEVCSLVDSFDGKRFSSPNDVTVRRDGNAYFTDPAWNVGDRVEELPQSLYRIDPEGNLSLVETFEEQRPNGVNLSPDGTLLYLALADMIAVYDVDARGVASNRREFVADTNVDGMALDCAGNVYASTGRVYSPDGETLGEFWGGTNLAFGGVDGKTLYITGHGRLTSRHVNIPGMPY